MSNGVNNSMKFCVNKIFLKKHILFNVFSVVFWPEA